MSCDITLCPSVANKRLTVDPEASKQIVDVSVLLRREEQSTDEDVYQQQSNTHTDAYRKAKREWARRNASHKKAYAAEWYEKNKEALSVKRKAQRDALKASPTTKQL